MFLITLKNASLSDFPGKGDDSHINQMGKCPPKYVWMGEKLLERGRMRIKMRTGEANLVQILDLNGKR